MRYNSAMGAFNFSVALRLLLVSSMIYCCFGDSVERNPNQISELEITTNAFQVGIHEYPTQPHHSTQLWELFLYLSPNRMETFVRDFSSFHSRNSQYYGGPDLAEDWINQQIRTVVDSYTSDSISIKKVASPAVGIVRAHNQENIIVKLEGIDPTLKNEVVILGAHYDSLNFYPTLDDDSAPGADDNATGCAVLLEVLRLIAQFGIQFKHTVEFHWYAAEEPGLWGSQDFVEQYLIDKTIVKGMLNLDTLGYQPSERGKGIKVYTDETESKLTAFVEMLIWHYLPGYRFIIDSTTKNGYPAAFVATAYVSPYLHTSRDTIDNVNFEQVREFAKLAVAFAIELGELVEVPVVVEPPAPIPHLTTESPKMTTGPSELSTDSSVMKPFNPSDTGKSVGVKLEERWMELGACLIGMWLFY